MARESAPPAPERQGGIAGFLSRYGRKLWWLHSVYALGLGVTIVLFARKGFEHTRWLTLTLSAAWLILVLFFRVVGQGSEQKLDSKTDKVRFFVMTYVLKNLYQGMLFFLLPFYWESSTPGTPNFWFLVLLAVSAIVATMDVVFDRFLMRWRLNASLFYLLTLFSCLNLLIPGLIPGVTAQWSLLGSAFLASASFFALHFPLRAWRQPPVLIALLVVTGSLTSLVWYARRAIPPAPASVTRAAVGHLQLPDGRLAVEVTSLHTSVIDQMVAVTEVDFPAGLNEPLWHVWRREGQEIGRIQPETRAIEDLGRRRRLQSTLSGGALPAERSGRWTVDVETEAGQIVGRTTFRVTE